MKDLKELRSDPNIPIPSVELNNHEVGDHVNKKRKFIEMSSDNGTKVLMYLMEPHRRTLKLWS